MEKFGKFQKKGEKYVFLVVENVIPTGKPTEPTEIPTEVHVIVSCTSFLCLSLHRQNLIDGAL